MSFAFNGYLLHWEHDCIFVLPLCLSVSITIMSKLSELNHNNWLKKKLYAKLIVLHLMVTHYILNIIAFCAAITLICQSLLQANYLRSVTIKYCITVNAMQRSSAAFTRLLVFFFSCENKLHHYKQSCDLRCITSGIVQCCECENSTLLAKLSFA